MTFISPSFKTLQRMKFKASIILYKPCMSWPLDVPLPVGFAHVMSFSQNGFLAGHTDHLGTFLSQGFLALCVLCLEYPANFLNFVAYTIACELELIRGAFWWSNWQGPPTLHLCSAPVSLSQTTQHSTLFEGFMLDAGGQQLRKYKRIRHLMLQNKSGPCTLKLRVTCAEGQCLALWSKVEINSKFTLGWLSFFIWSESHQF